MIPMKLKAKYLQVNKPKFGGKKRKNGDSGGVGRVAKALKRARVVSSRTGGGTQYQVWKRSMEHK